MRILFEDAAAKVEELGVTSITATVDPDGEFFAVKIVYSDETSDVVDLPEDFTDFSEQGIATLFDIDVDENIVALNYDDDDDEAGDDAFGEFADDEED
jgi:hypothetical protein